MDYVSKLRNLVQARDDHQAFLGENRKTRLEGLVILTPKTMGNFMELIADLLIYDKLANIAMIPIGFMDAIWMLMVNMELFYGFINQQAELGRRYLVTTCAHFRVIHCD